MDFPIERFSKIETPFYYYDIRLLRQTLDVIKTLTADKPAFKVHYAVKANANKRILQMISAAGLGADCVSGGEIAAALEAGFVPRSIVFAGVGKTDKEINLALDTGIHSFNVESLAELEVINELALARQTVADVAFRVNPDVDAHTHEKITTGKSENKFGISMGDVKEAVRRAGEMKGISYVGLHFHIGSQILDLEVYRQLCVRINEIQDALEAEGITSASINVGGGLGIDYDSPEANPVPCFAEYFSVFEQNLKLREGQELHFELGRSLVGQCGSLISRVLYIKEGAVKNFAIVDAGFTDLVRPAMYGAHHFTENISNPSAPRAYSYDVVGPICESSDVFSKNELLPQTRRGDFIAFRSAGAYGEIMASQYNCRKLPSAVYSDTVEA